MVFHIDLDPQPDPAMTAEYKEPLTYGWIVLGDYDERFISPLEYWSVTDYRRHWLQQAQRIVNGKSPACLITCIGNPEVAGRLQWWMLFRVGKQVFFREQIRWLQKDKFLDPLQGGRPVAVGFDLARPHELVGPRQTAFEEGDRPPSEWVLTISELEEFVRACSEWDRI